MDSVQKVHNILICHPQKLLEAAKLGLRFGAECSIRMW
jgi:hypothetical protein